MNEFDNAAEALSDLTGRPQEEFQYEGELPDPEDLVDVEEEWATCRWKNG